MRPALFVVALSAAVFGATFASHAGATAQIGGVVSAVAGGGDCSDSRSVPSATPQDTFGLIASAACNGNSAEAQVRADALVPSIGLRAQVVNGGMGSSASAFVALSDVWTIGVAPGTPVGTLFSLPVSFHLEGNVSSDAEYGRSPGRFLEFAGSFGQRGTASGVFQAGAVIDSIGAFDQTFAGLATFTSYGASVPTLGIFEASLFMPALYLGEVDFFHTLSAIVDVPPGFTVTSSSGAPLFAVTPVPEPETCMLLLVGLGVLGARLRRNHR